MARPAPRAATRPAKAAGPLLKRASYRPLRRAERWGVLLLGLTFAGGGAWGLVHLVKQSASPTHPVAQRRAAAAAPSAESQRPVPVIVYDSTLADDTGLYHTAETEADIAHSAPVPDAIPASTSPDIPLHTDSAKAVTPAAPAPPRDSTAIEGSPAP